jgi:hypothetical protein
MDKLLLKLKLTNFRRKEVSFRRKSGREEKEVNGKAL